MPFGSKNSFGKANLFKFFRGKCSYVRNYRVTDEILTLLLAIYHQVMSIKMKTIRFREVGELIHSYL